ncbi:MAG: 3,4-dihydroxy-2-butanone-4-phosphate synthase, partial [Proteobacteria bacterium]|nr:3,4-dihydroxy-2-butanone-4-phosphate synthase [Pseudomonadota bacterium]
GVLVRAGHTEAAVDIARMAGLDPSGVICEVMNDDGTMARLPDLVKFAQLHGLKVATITDIIAHRRRTERLIERVAETTITSRYGGEFKLYLYVNRVAYAEHIALVKGDIAGPEPVLVRMHALNVLGDVLGDTTVSRFGGGEARNRGGELQAAMRMIGEAGRGVVVMIREAKTTSLSDFLKQREGEAAKRPVAELRDYGVGAQILLDLGVKEMI